MKKYLPNWGIAATPEKNEYKHVKFMFSFDVFEGPTVLEVYMSINGVEMFKSIYD